MNFSNLTNRYSQKGKQILLIIFRRKLRLLIFLISVKVKIIIILKVNYNKVYTYKIMTKLIFKWNKMIVKLKILILIFKKTLSNRIKLLEALPRLKFKIKCNNSNVYVGTIFNKKKILLSTHSNVYKCNKRDIVNLYKLSMAYFNILTHRLIMFSMKS